MALSWSALGRSSFGVQSTPSPRARGAGADMSNAEIREANWPKLRNMLESQMMLVTSKLEQVQVRPQTPRAACESDGSPD